MATTIKITTIQCPNCGSTQKVELRPGDFCCESCGTEYFLDNGSVNTRPQPPGQQTAQVPLSKKRHATFFWLALLVFIIGFVCYRSVSTMSATTPPTNDTADDNSWYSRDGLLYLAADGRPVEIAFGVNRNYDAAPRAKDYVAFYDLRHKTQINRMPMPDAQTQGNEETLFDTRQFTNGDIYIVANDKVLSLVPKGAYTAREVTKTLFATQPQLVSGIAKITMLSKRDGEGFDLFTNDGQNYIYLPAADRLYTKKAFGALRPYIDYGRNHPVPGAIQQTGFDFTKAYNLDNAGTGAKLLRFRYMAPPGEPSDFSFEWLSYSPDTAAQLRRYGISSLKDLTPGRIYFSQRIIHYDSDYVLITYRLTPADDARRVIQCLNAQTGAVVFTTGLDDKYAPGNCIRYADGFVIEDDPAIYLLGMTGKFVTYNHIMGQRQ